MEIIEKLSQAEELEKEEALRERKDLYEQRRMQRTKVARLAQHMATVEMVSTLTSLVTGAFKVSYRWFTLVLCTHAIPLLKFHARECKRMFADLSTPTLHLIVCIDMSLLMYTHTHTHTHTHTTHSMKSGTIMTSCCVSSSGQRPNHQYSTCRSSTHQKQRNSSKVARKEWKVLILSGLYTLHLMIHELYKYKYIYTYRTKDKNRYDINRYIYINRTKVVCNQGIHIL